MIVEGSDLQSGIGELSGNRSCGIGASAIDNDNVLSPVQAVKATAQVGLFVPG
jgi:hypothetical protein